MASEKQDKVKNEMAMWESLAVREDVKGCTGVMIINAVPDPTQRCLYIEARHTLRYDDSVAVDLPLEQAKEFLRVIEKAVRVMEETKNVGYWEIAEYLQNKKS